MKEGSRSGNRPGRPEKERAPFGCLIVKSKGFESKVAKRPRLVLSDSESSEDLLMPHGGKLKACGANVHDVEFERKKIRSENVKCRESTSIERKRFVESEIGRKRGGMRSFEESEDDEVDAKMFKKEHFDDKGARRGRSGVLGSNFMLPSGDHGEFETECSRSAKLHKRQHFKFDRNSIYSVEQNSGSDQKFEGRKNGDFCSVSPLREKFESSCGQPIRVQGKNGVLKVMLNNKNKLSVSERSFGHKEAVDHKRASRHTDTSNWEAPPSPTLYSENKFRKRSHSVVVGEKNQVNGWKDLSEHSASRDSEAKISDQSMLMGPKHVATRGSKKGIKNKGKRALTSESNVSTRRKEGEVRRGSGTEKQLLREQIRQLLIDAGWTIDFRPRKNRNYQDAVYINPSGTEYWSIIKAYDALKKQYDDDSIDCNSFSPIPEEVLCQLTRQTRKKIEREKTMKQRGDRRHKNVKTSQKKLQKKHVKVNMERLVNGEALDCFTKKDDKSLKFRIKGDNSIVLKTKKSINLSNDAGFGEGECMHQVRNMGKEMLRPSFSTDVTSLKGRKYKKQAGRALLVRSSNKGANTDDDDFVPYTGKRTVLSWLIDMGTVPMSGKVQYMNKRRTRTLLEGWITKDGIHCGCCSKILAVSKFEIHAGSKLRQPFQYIFLENGVSLLQCHIDAWNRQEEPERDGFRLIDCDGDDPNDDTCAICGDGGDLICCDGCPSTFHQSCLDIQMLPVGDWHCPNCSCKFCRGIGGSPGQGEDMTLSLRTCNLCEEKYHQLCCQDVDGIPIDPTGLCTSFCGQSCKEIFQKLQKFLGVKQELDAGFSWTLIQRSNLDLDTSNRRLPQKAECNSKLAVALSVMDECFLPIIDRRSGMNLIHGVLYNCGSNFSRLNFSGFYTIVLEKGDEIISAASIRIHGSKLAEMPFIGTRHIYRRQGMCRRLLNAIESVLCSLNVERLVIPAISDLVHAWTMVFDFKPLEESHKQEMRSMNMLVFPGTGLLQKPLLTHNLTRGNVSDYSVVRAIELKSNDHPITENTCKSDIVSSEEPYIHSSDEGVIHHAQEMNNKLALTETIPLDPGNSTCDDTSNMTSGHEPKSHASPGKESAPDKEFLPHVRVICDNESKLLSSMKDINDAHGVDIEDADVDPDLHSSESCLEQATIVNSKYSDAAGVCIVQSTNDNLLHSSSDLVQENEIITDASVCEENVPCAHAETMEQNSCGLKSEVVAVLPDEYICEKVYVNCTPDIIVQHQDTAPVNSSQTSGYNVTYDSEDASQPHRISDCCHKGSGKTSAHHHNSCMLNNAQEIAFVATHAEPDSRRAEGEVTAGEYNLQTIVKDSVESTSKMESESSCGASNCNYLASTEFESCEFLPNMFNTYSDLTFLPASEAANNIIHNLADNSGAAFTDGSTLHISDQDSMLDTCDAEVEVTFVDPSLHMFDQASSPRAFDSVTEPNFHGSFVNKRICNPDHSLKISDSTSDLAQSVPSQENNYSFVSCVEPNSEASVGCNVQSMLNLKAEVYGEPNVVSLGQDSITDASNVNKSVDTSESIFSSCSRECLV